jgi:uncharacterized protein YbbC (DUF1343 family)
MKCTTFAFFLFFSCFQSTKKVETKPQIFLQNESQKVAVGAENTTEYLPFLKNKKVGLVVNQTSCIGETHLVDSLNTLKINVLSIFAPEHGFRGEADAGEKIIDAHDLKTGIKITSIYGKKQKPTAEDLANIDVVVFDIQDVGARFYTYLSTLFLVMQACADNQKELIILDRPNPNGHFVDGPTLEKVQKSFVGMLEIPLVHGCTMGEMAKMIVGEGWLGTNKTINLRVISCQNYTHQTIYDLPIKPSPNLPNLRSILLYPSLCLFEGTTVSVGRGTEMQFQILGHPSFLSDFCFVPMPNLGAKDPLYREKKCCGFDLNTLDIKELHQKKQIDLSWIFHFREQQAVRDGFFLENHFFDKLAGTPKLREQILARKTEAEIRESWQSDLAIFLIKRKNYLIYPE